MKRITQYDGLYGETSAEKSDQRIGGDYLFSELLETRSQGFDWTIQPHIHARLFQVFFIETGQFEFLEATRKYQLTGPCLLLIPPAALHGFVYHFDARGRTLTLSGKLVDGLFEKASAPTAMLELVQCLTKFDDSYSAIHVHQLMELIDKELFDDLPEKHTMLRVHLQQFFLVLFRLWRQDEAQETGPSSLSLQYFRRFQQRIRQAGTSQNVAQMADDLAITPVHLNRICRAVANKSDSQLVQEHILDEARKFLTYTTYTVSEIAYLLHFDYPNYFARFLESIRAFPQPSSGKGNPCLSVPACSVFIIRTGFCEMP